jgi:hypothetical protein
MKIYLAPLNGSPCISGTRLADLMKRKETIALSALALAMGFWSVLPVEADDAFNGGRFYGGSHDGFDVSAYVQTSEEQYNVDPTIFGARYVGSIRDGWGMCTVTGLKLPAASGSVVCVR